MANIGPVELIPNAYYWIEHPCLHGRRQLIYRETDSRGVHLFTSGKGDVYWFLGEKIESIKYDRTRGQVSYYV